MKLSTHFLDFNELYLYKKKIGSFTVDKYLLYTITNPVEVGDDEARYNVVVVVVVDW